MASAPPCLGLFPLSRSKESSKDGTSSTMERQRSTATLFGSPPRCRASTPVDEGTPPSPDYELLSPAPRETSQARSDVSSPAFLSPASRASGRSVEEIADESLHHIDSPVGPVAARNVTVPAELPQPSQDPEEVLWCRLGTATLSKKGLQGYGLPLLPTSAFELSRMEGQDVIRILNPLDPVSFRYLDCLPAFVPQAMQAVSRKTLNGRALRLLSFTQPNLVARRHSDEASVLLPQFPLSSTSADKLRLAKGFGDETRVHPVKPLIPVSFENPEDNLLLGFLQAEPLSPTSHRLREESGSRTNDPLTPVQRLTDTDLRRTARSMTSVSAAFQAIRAIAGAKEDEHLLAIRRICEMAEQDVLDKLTYDVTKAVHYRRNIIQASLMNMPQEEVRNGLLALPLASSSGSLLHESASDSIDKALAGPASRPLAVIKAKAKVTPRPSQKAGPSKQPPPPRSRPEERAKGISGRRRTFLQLKDTDHATRRRTRANVAPVCPPPRHQAAPRQPSSSAARSSRSAAPARSKRPPGQH